MCSTNLVLVVGLAGYSRQSPVPVLPLCGEPRPVAVLSRKAALSVLARQTVSVILTTPKLPDGSWDDLISDTAPMPARPNVIVVTSGHDGPPREEVLALGAYGLLTDLSPPGDVEMLIESADRDWARRCRRPHAGQRPPTDSNTRPVNFPAFSQPAPILLISPSKEDHDELPRILGRRSWHWRFAETQREAQRICRTNTIAVTICERDLSDGCWRDVLIAGLTLPAPPSLVVCSLQADERLWAEALNLGAYDVLEKPFDHREVSRVAFLACYAWARSNREETLSSFPEAAGLGKVAREIAITKVA